MGVLRTAQEVEQDLAASTSRMLAARIVDLMNEALELDRDAVEALCSHRVFCGAKLAAHATVQVKDDGDGVFSVGLLGILNGIAGVDGEGRGYVAAMTEGGKILSFEVLDREVA